MTYESKQSVQYFLDNLRPMQDFVVVFTTKEGEQRKYKGTLDPNSDTRKEVVAMVTDNGWKKFNLNNVLSIDYDWS